MYVSHSYLPSPEPSACPLSVAIALRKSVILSLVMMVLMCDGADVMLYVVLWRIYVGIV